VRCNCRPSLPAQRSSRAARQEACQHALGVRFASHYALAALRPCARCASQVAREIEHLKECDHANIVQYHGCFVHDERLWIMMEYCEGSALLDVMAASGRCLTQVQVAAALSCCTSALQYLHARHKVHRDVKAGNLLLSSDGLVKLADFGVAAMITSTTVRRRTVIGTPFWMAPEVITARRGPSGGGSKGYDQLADIWSLGITAIEVRAMACRRRPLLALHHPPSPSLALHPPTTHPPPTLRPPSTTARRGTAAARLRLAAHCHLPHPDAAAALPLGALQVVARLCSLCERLPLQGD
jgi:serine/threonine protein kinase